MNNPLISIIIPIYNAEKFLERCVNSILNQTYKNLQIILVNDGSKDNSLNICKELAQKDSRILILDKPNGGAASARNLGLKHATGDYIGFCDADDWLETDTYRTMIELLEKENANVVRFSSSSFDEDGNLIKKGEDSKEVEITPAQEFLRKIYRWEGDVSLATRVFKADIIKDIIIPEGRRVEDFFFSICLFNKIEEDILYKYPFYNYTVNTQSVTHSATGAIYFDALYFFNKAKDICKYDCEEEQEYYLFKLYYLISISLTRKECKQFEQEMDKIKKDLRARKTRIDKNPYLKRKEREILKIACVFFRVPRWLYCIKNWRDRY